jgi:phosphoesterase RecJ-like protein
MTSFDAYLKNTASVAIAGHVRPDGDCVGSCLAVYNYIHDNYPKLVLDVYLEPIPDKFRFLKNSEVIQNAVEADETKIYDLFIALDCGDCGRLGAAAGLFEKAKKTVCVDHHISNLAFADENYIVPDASSTCELVYGLMNFDKITKEIAECIYLGIAHDTGVFQYSCTSSKTMQIAGALMDKGINYSKIVDETYYIKSYNQNRIWGKALMDSELYLDGRCIFSMIKKEDMQAYGVTPKDLDGIVSHLRSTIGVEVSIFLYQNEDDTYKISLRSASYVDVAKIAVTYGGGGHCRAAGASTNQEPKQILESLLAQIEEQLKENEGASCITES